MCQRCFFSFTLTNLDNAFNANQMLPFYLIVHLCTWKHIHSSFLTNPTPVLCALTNCCDNDLFQQLDSWTYLTTCLCLLFNITHLSMSFCLSTMWASSGGRCQALCSYHKSQICVGLPKVTGYEFSFLSTCFPWSEEPGNRCPVYELIPRKTWSQRSLQEMLHIVQGCRRE